MGKLVSIDLSDEEFEASMRRFEEEKRWKKANPQKHKLRVAIVTAIIALEELQEAFRNS